MGFSASKRKKEGEKNKLINSGFEQALAYIENKNTKGFGFLCKLPLPNSDKILPALITTTDLIGKNEIEVSKQIKFKLENSSHTLTINDERKIYIDEEKYKIVIIEIKSDDNLNIDSFFELEEKQNLEKDGVIGVMTNNEKEKCLEYYICKINNIKENEFVVEYACKSKKINESKGNPIINIKNNNIFGIQNNSGFGLLLKEPIKEFLEADLKKEKETKKIYQSLKSSFTLKSTIKADESKLDKEIGIFYLIAKKPGITVLKIFGEKFVENNKDKCKLILYDEEKDEEYEEDLCAYLDLDFIISINSGKPIIKIFLKQIDYFYDLSYMFFECFTLLSVEGLNDLYFDQVTNMRSMFHSCTFLQEITIDGINTSQVKDMSFMFEKCASLEYLNLSGWNTTNVTTMKAMFELCEKLEEIEGLGDWDLPNLKDSSFMFNFCKNLTEFSGIAKWNTTSVTDMSNMFKCLESVEDFPDISKWETKNVKSMDECFVN